MHRERILGAGLVAAIVTGCARDVAPPRTEPARIAFLEKPGDIGAWDFDVKGLPAVDLRTGDVLVADLSHGFIASSLGLVLRWLAPGAPDAKEPSRQVVLLADVDASRVMNEVDEPDAPRETEALAKRVRTATREANDLLAKTALRPLVACRLEAKPGPFCQHPQRMTCGAIEAELRGDVLAWRGPKGSGATKLGWAVAPMTIGDGPPKEMVTCLEEAHVDPETLVLAARSTASCKGGGSDACILPDVWRAARLR